MSLRNCSAILNRHRKLAALSALLLAFAFSANLTHGHDGDHRAYAECAICLKLDHDDELKIPSRFESEFVPGEERYPEAALTPHFIDIVDVRSRSPPRT